MFDSAGMQGAGQGAQAGAMFGPWGMAIGAGAGYVLGQKEGKRKDKEMAKAIEEQAKLMRVEAARAQADIRRARTMEITNTAASLRHIERQSGMIKADISVQNATADAIGASALAVYTDADSKQSEAEAATRRSMEYNLENIAMGLDSMLYGSKMQMRNVANQYKMQDTSKQDMASGLLGLGQAGGSLWAKGAFDTKKTKTENVGPTNRAGVF
jgi:hypothetical protein